MVYGFPTYMANLCPIHCGGAVSYSTVRMTILHNEDAGCKGF